MPMSNRGHHQSGSSWFVSIPLSWIVLGGLLVVAAVIGGVTVAIGAVVTHPGSALQMLAFVVVSGLALYGFCWMLAHRGGRSSTVDPSTED